MERDHAEEPWKWAQKFALWCEQTEMYYPVVIDWDPGHEPPIEVLETFHEDAILQDQLKKIVSAIVVKHIKKPVQTERLVAVRIKREPLVSKSKPVFIWNHTNAEIKGEDIITRIWFRMKERLSPEEMLKRKANRAKRKRVAEAAPAAVEEEVADEWGYIETRPEPPATVIQSPPAYRNPMRRPAAAAAKRAKYGSTVAVSPPHPPPPAPARQYIPIPPGYIPHQPYHPSFAHMPAMRYLPPGPPQMYLPPHAYRYDEFAPEYEEAYNYEYGNIPLVSYYDPYAQAFAFDQYGRQPEYGYDYYAPVEEYELPAQPQLRYAPAPPRHRAPTQLPQKQAAMRRRHREQPQSRARISSYDADSSEIVNNGGGELSAEDYPQEVQVQQEGEDLYEHSAQVEHYYEEAAAAAEEEQQPEPQYYAEEEEGGEEQQQHQPLVEEEEEQVPVHVQRNKNIINNKKRRHLKASRSASVDDEQKWQHHQQPLQEADAADAAEVYLDTYEQVHNHNHDHNYQDELEFERPRQAPQPQQKQQKQRRRDRTYGGSTVLTKEHAKLLRQIAKKREKNHAKAKKARAGAVEIEEENDNEPMMAVPIQSSQLYRPRQAPVVAPIKRLPPPKPDSDEHSESF